MSLSGNKGEWSEIYVLFKLLTDKKLYEGDINLNRIEELFYPIIKIIRHENNKINNYEIDGDIVIISNNTEQVRIPIDKFRDAATILLTKIKKKKEKESSTEKKSTASFRVPELEAMLEEIKCSTLRAKSSVKTDITIVIYDTRLGKNETLGFSIKSLIGGKATLLNAGKTTNFIYEIKNFNTSPEIIDKINKGINIQS